MSEGIEISVIVPVRLAEETVGSTLAALLGQATAEVEVIAVFCEDDPSARVVAAMDHPALRKIQVAGTLGVPHLRRTGVTQSRGAYVMIAEDHCLFPAGWLRGLRSAIEQNGADVSGGPVENGRPTYAGWAQYFTRYSLFMPPVSNGWTGALPGNNACYRRDALDGLAGNEGFWEAEYNQQLRAGGGRMWMCPELAVVQRQERGAFEYIPLRYRHGRCYGARRPGPRGPMIARSPLIPAILFARAVRSVMAKKRNRLRFLCASPLLLVYIFAWSAGEIAGYLFGAGGSCRRTD